MPFMHDKTEPPKISSNIEVMRDNGRKFFSIIRLASWLVSYSAHYLKNILQNPW
jgi:hypothetical protein